MPKIPKTVKAAKKQGKPCVACEGTGQSSRGKDCFPCAGTGEEGYRYKLSVPEEPPPCKKPQPSLFD